MTNPKKFIVTARVCLVHDEKILLVRGKTGMWHLPGGHLDMGETLPECAARETYEETGYKPAIGDIIYCFEYHDKYWNSHKIENVFLGSIESAKEQSHWQDLGHDQSIEAQEWFSLSELENIKFAPHFLLDGKWLRPQDTDPKNAIYHGTL